jgi:mRNA interferase RelE/StbE
MAERPRYTVELSTTALKALKRVPNEVATRLLGAANALSLDPRPRGCVKLEGANSEYRIRVGDYRLIYSVWDDKLIVLVIDLGHRKDIYR